MLSRESVPLGGPKNKRAVTVVRCECGSKVADLSEFEFIVFRCPDVGGQVRVRECVCSDCKKKMVLKTVLGKG